MNSAAHAVFDTPEAIRINKARQEAVRELLVTLRTTLALRTALDVGCGVGHFSCFIRDLGFTVVAADGRKENISEAKLRYPQVDFHVADVETDSLTKLGSFDLVFCMGLLYHLENPLRCIRGLRKVTRTCLVLESMCFPEETPWMLLREEPRQANQSMTDVAFYPTEGCLIKMLYRSGFSQVYRLRELPNHDDFRETADHLRRRTVLVASSAVLDSRTLIPLVEPREYCDPWNTTDLLHPNLLQRVRDFLHKPLPDQSRSVYARWKKAFPSIPFPVRLPFGAWFIARGDYAGSTLTADAFELAERNFLQRFLQPGMIVLDVGAHHGLYSLLAATQVGGHGAVYSFEPSPREQKALKLNLRLNRFRNVRIQPFALGNEETSADLYVVNKFNTGCNSLKPPAVQDSTSCVPVRVRTLDNWLAEQKLPRIDFIKLDVEGGELDALKGAERTLQAKPRPLIMCEMESVRTRPWGYEPTEIARYLHKLGFQWFQATMEGNLLSLPTEAHQFEGNYIAVPEERRGQVSAHT